ncbi:MAG TPA: hypothetical protein VGE52_11005, partial [Pirellulales bacterium]
RRRSPVPSYTNLDATQRGQHDLLVRLMQDVTCPIESESGRTRRDWVRILETTPIGLIAAHTLFAAARVVALLRDELHAWQEKLPAPSGPFRWYAVSSRLVEPGLPPIRRGKSATDAQRRAHDQALAAISLPPGAEPWVVTHGYSVGPLASAETEEIWAWDGREARFHSLWSDWLS